MAIDWNTAKFLVACHRVGMSLTRTLSLGRQFLLLRLSSARASSSSVVKRRMIAFDAYPRSQLPTQSR
jgi:hypothetical protein